MSGVYGRIPGALEREQPYVLQSHVPGGEKGQGEAAPAQEEATLQEVESKEAHWRSHEEIEQAGLAAAFVHAARHDLRVIRDGRYVVGKVALGVVEQVTLEHTDRALELDPVVGVVAAPVPASSVEEPELTIGIPCPDRRRSKSLS